MAAIAGEAVREDSLCCSVFELLSSALEAREERLVPLTFASAVEFKPLEL